jgi:transcriptional regulator with XRE-family HTH domain
LNLGLLRRQVGDRIGVNGTTITNWERNATVPAIRYVPAIIRFLGYDPLPQTSAFPERLAIARKALGLSPRRMAEVLRVDQGTLHGWESGTHKPTRKNVVAIEGYFRRFNTRLYT